MDEATLRTLDREPYVSLVTFRKSGAEVATPVWWALHEGRFYVFTEARSGKMKRLRNDARVKLAGCGVRGKVHGDWYAGQARVVEEEATIARAYEVLRAKYGWQMRVTNLLSRLSGRIHGRAMLEITVEGPAAA